MKILFVLLVFSVTAFGCPNLVGTYNCSLNSSILTISQSESQGVTTFIFTSNNGQKPVKADGVTKTGIVKDGVFQGAHFSETNSCVENKSLKHDFKVEELGFTTTKEFRLNEKSDLEILTYDSFNPKPSVETCLKN